MFDYGYDAIVNLRDSVRGVVTGQNKAGGLYIDILVPDEETGEETVVPVFGYWCSRVNRGTPVFCTIKKWAREDDDHRTVVRVDSVDYDNAAPLYGWRPQVITGQLHKTGSCRENEAAA